MVEGRSPVAQGELLVLDSTSVMSRACLSGFHKRTDFTLASVYGGMDSAWRVSGCVTLAWYTECQMVAWCTHFVNVKGNSYLLRVFIFFEMCCISAFLIKTTVTPLLFTGITDREHFYFIWQFLDWLTESHSWNLLGIKIRMYLCQSVSVNETFYFLFPWNVSTLVSRKYLKVKTALLFF